jgi:hypothetical protein
MVTEAVLAAEVGVGVGVRVAVGDRVALAVGDAVAAGDGVAVRAGVGVAALPQADRSKGSTKNSEKVILVTASPFCCLAISWLPPELPQV